MCTHVCAFVWDRRGVVHTVKDLFDWQIFIFSVKSWQILSFHIYVIISLSLKSGTQTSGQTTCYSNHCNSNLIFALSAIIGHLWSVVAVLVSHTSYISWHSMNWEKCLTSPDLVLCSITIWDAVVRVVRRHSVCFYLLDWWRTKLCLCCLDEIF